VGFGTRWLNRVRDEPRELARRIVDCEYPLFYYRVSLLTER
jgi:hypothetical protein